MSENEMLKIVEQVLDRPLHVEEEQRFKAAWIEYKDPRRMYRQVKSLKELVDFMVWLGNLDIEHFGKPALQIEGKYHGQTIVAVMCNGARAFLGDGVWEEGLATGLIHKNPERHLGYNEYVVDVEKALILDPAHPVV